MPRIITPPRNRPAYNSKGLESIPIQRFNYTYLIPLAIIVCSVLFCGIQDTLRYLKFITVVIVIIALLIIMKPYVRRLVLNNK
jgi:hypothetical protein